MNATAPVRIALIDDYDVVLFGIARMLGGYRSRIEIVEIDANAPLKADVDIALYDSFAQTDTVGDDIASLAKNPHAKHVVVYTWNFTDELVDQAMAQGADGYISKTLPARELVTCLENVAAGEKVITKALRHRSAAVQDWPGRTEGLTDREAEILALMTQGKDNREIAELTFLSPETVKTYIRNLYRKINVTNRTKAALWGVAHGFQPDHHRIRQWRV